MQVYNRLDEYTIYLKSLEVWNAFGVNLNKGESLVLINKDDFTGEQKRIVIEKYMVERHLKKELKKRLLDNFKIRISCKYLFNGNI